MKSKCIVWAAFVAAYGTLLGSDEALAKLKKEGARVILVESAPRNPNTARHSSTPIPLAPGRFIVPFVGTDVANSVTYFADRFQPVNDQFAKDGPPGTIYLSSDPTCCGQFAENGGAKLAGGTTQVAIPKFTFESAYEVFGYFVQANGTPVDLPVRLTREKDGHQSAPVIVALEDGTAFAMWSDFFHEVDESEVSVRGAFLSADGEPVGADILIESKDVGQQIPVDGAQLANGRLLLVWKQSTNANRAAFRGRVMRPDGKLGKNFKLATAGNFGTSELRVAALPNGDFVAVWVDDSSGTALPYYQMFSETGEPLGEAQLVGPSEATTGQRLDVAALADSRFVITGALTTAGQADFIAQLVAPNGDKLDGPLVLQSFNGDSKVREHHSANVGYLVGLTVPDVLATATDPELVYVVWRIDRGGNTYDLFGQALRAKP